PWIWGSAETFEVLIGRPAHGSLRHRVLAARALEVSVEGMPPTTDPALVGRTLQVLQPLLLHPEPLVWIHAARALGRLAGSIDALEGTLLDWVRADSPLLRQRALTAFASLPAARLGFLGSQLVRILDSPDEEPWALAALAAATPYLFFERRALWDRLQARILGGDGGAIAARALVRGLATLWRRGVRDAALEAPMRKLRALARRARASALDDRRRWIEVIAVTDPIDGAERDPLDLELGLENLVRIAAQYDDEEGDARAARFADSLARTFAEARKIALGVGTLRQRAAAINAVEGCARSLALRLWGPLLATRPAGRRPRRPARPRGAGEDGRARAGRDPRARRAAPPGGRRRPRAGRAARGARHPPRRLRARRARGGLGARPGPRPERARHVPVAAQARGPRRRVHRSADPAPERALRALLAPRRHDARHGARRGGRRRVARPLRGVVGPRHRPAHDAAPA